MKSKQFIRLFAFGSVCVFVIILLLTVGLSISAASGSLTSMGLTSDKWLNSSDFANSEVYDSNSNITFPHGSYNWVNGYKTYSFPLDDLDFDYEDYSCFCGWQISTDTMVYSCFPAGSFVNNYGSEFEIFVPSGEYSSFPVGLVQAYYDGGLLSARSNGTNTYNFDSGTFTFNDIDYLCYTSAFGSAWSNLYFTNMPLYSVYNIKQQMYDGNITGFSDLSDLNYTGSIYPEDGEDSSNNIYMPDADFTFKNTTFTAPYNVNFNTGSIYPNGNITFSFLPNDYQISHSSDFKIRLSFDFDYDVNYKNYGDAFSVFEQTSDLRENMKNYHARWYYDSGDMNYIYIELSDFISSGNSVSYTFIDILSNCSNRDTGYEAVVSNSKELNYVEYNKFNINCTAELISNAVSSGAYTEWYNPMNKKGYTTDSSGTKNNNPYTGENNTDVVPSGTGAGGTAGVGGDNSNNIGGGSGSNNSNNNDSYSSVGNIVITNNNNAYGGTGKGGNSSGGYGTSSETSEAAIGFWNTFNPFKLIFNKLTGDVNDISEDVANELSANGFISMMSTIFGFLPTQIWTVLTWFLVATLSILVITFIVRIILDLL